MPARPSGESGAVKPRSGMVHTLCAPKQGRSLADGLHVAVEVERVVPALTTDSRLARPAEGRLEVANVEAVHPDRARDDGRRHAVRARLGAGVDRRRQPVVGRVREPEGLLLVLERLERENRAEYLTLEDLRVSRDVREQGRRVVEPVERLAPEHEPGARLERALDVAGHTVERDRVDQRTVRGRLL